MKTQKLISAALAALLLLCSCGSNNPPAGGDTTTEPTVTTDAPVSSEPDLDAIEIYSGLLKENGRYDLTATDYVKVKTELITGLKLPKSVHTASDDQLTVAIAEILSDFADDTVHLDREIRLGDTVNIDYVGSINGVEFEGGTTMGNGTDVTIGVTSYIDDFLYQLIGHKAGETVNVQVTFPENYGKEELNGKDALFVTKINYILSQPELTDDFVGTYLSSLGCKTAAELKDMLATNIVTEATNSFIYDHISSGFEVTKVPEALIENQIEQMLDFYVSYANSYGMDLDSFLTAAMNTTKEQLMKDMRPECELIARRALTCQAIAETLGYEASDTHVLAYFGKYYGTSDITSYKDSYGMPYLKQIVTEQKVIDHILENAVKE